MVGTAFPCAGASTRNRGVTERPTPEQCGTGRVLLDRQTPNKGGPRQAWVPRAQLALLWIHAKSLGNASNLLLNFQKSHPRMSPVHPRNLLKPVFLLDTNKQGLKLTSNQTLLFTDVSLPCSSGDTFHNAEACTEPSLQATCSPSSGQHLLLPSKPTGAHTRVCLGKVVPHQPPTPGNAFSAPSSLISLSPPDTRMAGQHASQRSGGHGTGSGARQPGTGVWQEQSLE